MSEVPIHEPYAFDGRMIRHCACGVHYIDGAERHDRCGFCRAEAEVGAWAEPSRVSPWVGFLAAFLVGVALGAAWAAYFLGWC